VITVDSINTRLFRDIALNTLQVLVNQVLGVFIFLLLSRSLDKDIYGELNWSLAVLTLITTILSLRLEQIVVRNVAAGKDPSAMLTLFLAHNAVTGLIFLGGLLAASFLFPAFFHRHYILWILSISQLLTFFSLPFRQLATGQSAFGWLTAISTVSNIIRCGWIGWLAAFSAITLPRVLIIFILSAGVEFILGGYIVVRKLKVPFSTRQNFATYQQLIKESLPQVGLVFLNAGIARIDWILMGFLSTRVHTAEYSFAYRAYEFSPLPLLILAPFLLNSFSRYFSGPGSGSALTGGPAHTPAPAWLGLFVRLSAIFATLLPLWGMLLWAPLVDLLTHHKYGQVNNLTFLLLSVCIPFQYLINICWSAEFAANRLGRIFAITAVTAVIVVAGDCLLIPAYGGQGAAMAYLVSMIVQYGLYSRISIFAAARKEWPWQMFMAIAIAAASGEGALLLTDSVPLQLGIATVLYALLTWGSGRLGEKTLPRLRQHLGQRQRHPLYPIPGKMAGK